MKNTMTPEQKFVAYGHCDCPTLEAREVCPKPCANSRLKAPTPDAIKLWYAELDTRSFHFEGFGQTEYAARRALHTALSEHAEQHGLDLLSRGWYFPDDCRVREIVIGQGYRDREPLGGIHPHAKPNG